MNPNFTFDAEGVFDQPIKPLRIRKRTKRVRTTKYAAEIATRRDRAAIKRTMHCPKLLSSSMPRVILKDKYLQRPRSAESEFGLKWQPPKKKPIERRSEQRRSWNRRRTWRYLDNCTGTRVIMRSGVHCLTFSYREVKLTLVFPDGRGAVTDRRSGNRRDPPKESREKPDKYLFNSLFSNKDGKATIKKEPMLNKNDEEVYAVAKGRNHAQAMRKVKAFDRIGTS
jgi:hypothetical protein